MRSPIALFTCRVIALGFLCCASVPAWAADGGKAPSRASSPAVSGTLIDFDLPAQPLIDALKLYGTQTRQPALFRSEMVNGKTSAPVRGRYAPAVALRLLLEGTGLVAEKFDHGSTTAFVLKARASGDEYSEESSPAESLVNLTGYPGMVQARVWQALCASALTAPGRYRSLLRFQVDMAGQVQRPRLMGSSGDAARDAAIVAALAKVRMDGPPPPDLPQPVTMLLLPHDAGFVMSCDQASGGDTAQSGMH